MMKNYRGYKIGNSPGLPDETTDSSSRVVNAQSGNTSLMLSYRHGYHAGNHADVLKHTVQLLLIDYLSIKDNPFWIIDTHAGAGTYRLDDEFAVKNREFESGISKLFNAEEIKSAALNHYLNSVRNCNTSDKLIIYPGSPQLSLSNLRDQDKLRLFELHSRETEILELQLPASDKRVKVIRDNGFQGLKSLLPPPSRRGLILIDPSYELPADYDDTLECVQQSVKRFATGVYAVWFPLLSRDRARNLREQLQAMDSVNWLCATIQVSAASENGMYGSGVFVINPPWTLEDSLTNTLPEMANLLGQDRAAGFTLKTQTPED